MKIDLELIKNIPLIQREIVDNCIDIDHYYALTCEFMLEDCLKITAIEDGWESSIILVRDGKLSAHQYDTLNGIGPEGLYINFLDLYWILDLHRCLIKDE